MVGIGTYVLTRKSANLLLVVCGKKEEQLCECVVFNYTFGERHTDDIR